MSRLKGGAAGCSVETLGMEETVHPQLSSLMGQSFSPPAKLYLSIITYHDADLERIVH